MYSVSPEQIKAARSLLAWTQDDLAQESGVSSKTINKLENGEGISIGRLIEIKKSLEGKGIEFLGNKGVIRNTDDPKNYGGPEGCDQVYEDMLFTAKKHGGEILAMYKTAEHLARSLGVTNYANLERLERLSKYATVRCLLTDARNSSLSVPCVQFRAISQPVHNIWSTFVCGDKHVIVFMKDGADSMYYVMRSVDIVLAETKYFVPLWNTGLPLVVQNNPQRIRG